MDLVINTQPQSQSIAPGQTATLSVAATGIAGLTYQWYQGLSGNTANPIAGATNSTFTTPALTATTNYWVQVSGALPTLVSRVRKEQQHHSNDYRRFPSGDLGAATEPVDCSKSDGHA